MSTTPGAPAGWYPDATNGNRLRYWDGVRWTEHFAAPEAAALAAPAGTDPNTPWIWLHLAMPLIASIPNLFIDWGSLVTIDPENPQAMLDRQLAVYSSPAYIISVVLPFLTYAAGVVFAFLDFRTLERRGVPRPFHWAFAFIPYYVYPIGRGIVAKRRTGRGIASTYVAIGLIVLGLVLGIVFAVVIFSAIFSQIPTTTTF